MVVHYSAVDNKHKHVCTAFLAHTNRQHNPNTKHTSEKIPSNFQLSSLATAFCTVHKYHNTLLCVSCFTHHHTTSTSTDSIATEWDKARATASVIRPRSAWSGITRSMAAAEVTSTHDYKTQLHRCLLVTSDCSVWNSKHISVFHTLLWFSQWGGWHANWHN
jgi:hypothetical protein